MKEIWANDAAEYHGEFVNFDPIWSYPKPVQKPHPPILLGTLSSKGLDRVARYCDGWIPVGIRPKDLPAAIRDLNERAVRAGRKPAVHAGSIRLEVCAARGAGSNGVVRRRAFGCRRVGD